MGSGFGGEERWVFGVGDEVRLRDGARGWEAWRRSAQGVYAGAPCKLWLDAVYARLCISIRDLGFLGGF